MFRILILIQVFLFQTMRYSEVAAQSATLLDDFSLYISNDKIVLNWTISGGNTCNGIKIFRSSDTISYTQIGFISGICGSSSTPVSYNFTDEYPVPNRYNYYRLELGTLGFTNIISIEYIKYDDKGYQVRPHPVIDQSTIYFKNELQKKYDFKLFDALGKLIRSDESVSSDSYLFNKDELPAGNYLFLLESKDEIYLSGKLILQ